MRFKFLKSRSNFKVKVKGLVSRNTHVEYESPIFCCSLVLTKVVFVYGRQQQRNDNNAGGYGNSSPDFRNGELKRKRSVSVL